MSKLRAIAACLWFDDQAEEAAKFYTSVFKDSKLGKILRYSKAGREIHGREPGSVMTVTFELHGQKFTALNGGPLFKFNESISFEVHCDSQEEVDYYWEKLSEGANPKAQQCGWLKDRYGVSWQVIPAAMLELFDDHTSVKTERAMNAMLKMKKLDLAALQRAYEGT